MSDIDKKKCVIFFNCHGGQIMNNLLSCPRFNNLYDCTHITNYDYLKGYKYGNENDIINKHKKIINDCDLLILQHIRTYNREIIHHEYIKTLIKSNCKYITISHFTFSGLYPEDSSNNKIIDKNSTKNEIENFINNSFTNKEEIIEHFNSELDHLRELDKNSDIKCLDFVKNNYTKYLLFHSRWYPTSYFFIYISNEILKLLNIVYDIEFINNLWALDNQIPLYPNVKKHLQLDFNINYCLNANLIEYIYCMKQENFINFKKRNDKTNLYKIIKEGKFK
jgi:hypothetical protein